MISDEEFEKQIINDGDKLIVNVVLRESDMPEVSQEMSETTGISTMASKSQIETVYSGVISKTKAMMDSGEWPYLDTYCDRLSQLSAAGS